MLPYISLTELKGAVNRWLAVDGSRLGAALAFYTLLSLAPLLVFLVGMVALVFDRTQAQQWLLHQIQENMGAQGAAAARNLLKHAIHGSSGVIAGIISALTLLFGASGAFNELRNGLNAIWAPQESEGSGWKRIAAARLFSFGMVIAIGFLLLVSLVISTSLSAFFNQLNQAIATPAPVLSVVNFCLSLYLIALLFALIFKCLPSVKLEWTHLWRGALFTSALFTVGKGILGLYLGVASVGSAYGAAGSLVAVVVWVYYSAQIFYFGAAVTWVAARGVVRKEHTSEGGSPLRRMKDLSKSMGA